MAHWLTYIFRYKVLLLESALPVELYMPIIWMTVFWLGLFALRRMYRTPVALSRFDELVRCFKSVVIGVVLIYLVTFDYGEPILMTRIFPVLYGITVFLFIGIGRVVVRTIHRRIRWKGIGLWNALIIGNNEIGRRLYNQLFYAPVWGFRVVGVIDRDPDASVFESDLVVGRITDLPDIIREKKIHWILVAPSGRADEALLDVFDRCGDQRVRFMIVADYYQMVVGLVRTVEIHGLPLVEVAPRLVAWHVRMLKRFIDILAGLLMAVVLAIITPVLALIIKLDSPGPVFYHQKRVGKGGREFTLSKFRSMVKDAEKQSGAVWAARNDPRITRVGKLLRRTHIDEIPQFLNVLIGDMSLVGPRPERLEFVKQFNDKIPLYERRLRIRPGITGWAQVRYKYDESLKDVSEKTRYDLFYIDHVSVALDIKIILATILKVLQGEGH